MNTHWFVTRTEGVLHPHPPLLGLNSGLGISRSLTESSLLRKWIVQTDGVSSPTSHGVAFIKRATVSILDESLPVGAQLQVG